MTAHPDRLATTLLGIGGTTTAPAAPPGAGAHDARIDLKLLVFRAGIAASRSAAATAHLQRWLPERHPDLWAGTVQDGVARGFMVALEEAIALAPPAAPAVDPFAGGDGPVVVGKDLRKRKDLLVKSGGARVRFSRKEGLLFVDREDATHSSNCLRFEARRDLGSLDGFAADAAERPRLFSAQFLQPARYLQGSARSALELVGRLGRGPDGFAARIVLAARTDEPHVELLIAIDNRHTDHRLRARFLGIPTAAIAHDCTDVREIVQNDRTGFVAFTLVRAIGRLQAGDREIATPGAQCQGWIEHRFRLGPAG